MRAKSPHVSLVRKFFETDLISASHSLETFPEEEALALLKSLSPTLRPQVFPHLSTGFAVNLLSKASMDLFQEIINSMEPRQAANIFFHLPQDKKEYFIENLNDQAKKQIQDLLLFPINSAGRMMSSDFVAFHTDVRVREAIQRLRQIARTKKPLSYVYILDQENHLVGNLNMRDLLLAAVDETVESIMRRDVFSVSAFTDREVVAEALSNHHYFAIPVVDSENRMLGVVLANEIIDDVKEEASENILRMFGAGGDERTFSPISFAIRKRLPWLYVNLGTAFLAASVVSLFEDTIARLTILAVFLPVVAGQGGNAGAQSLAVVMRGLVMNEIPPHKFWTSIFKETMLGFINGILVGIVTAAIAWLWHGNPMLGVVIGLAMIVNLLAAGAAGAAIPLTMKSLGGDPAQSSSIILTTVTDVVGFFAFLGFAVIFQKYLIV